MQKGDVAKGKAILDVLQRVADENGVKKSGNVVAVLLSDIAGQIKRMKETKDQALTKTKDNYIAFLDVIAAELEKKGYDNNSVVLMGHAYSSLELPVKAAAVFSKYKAPAVVDKKIDKKGKLTEDEEADLSRYWGARVEYVRALRACKDAESLKKATAALDDLLKHPHARFKMYAEMEKYHIFEDQQKYRQSLQGWNGFLKGLQPQLAKPEVQKVYFPAYVDATRIMYKVGTLDKESPPLKDPGKFITGAAKTSSIWNSPNCARAGTWWGRPSRICSKTQNTTSSRKNTTASKRWREKGRRCGTRCRMKMLRMNFAVPPFVRTLNLEG